MYRSHLLGADRGVCSIFGGNTGARSLDRDFRSRGVNTVWVKGSGSKLATMQRKDFAGLRMADVLPLRQTHSPIQSTEEWRDHVEGTIFHCRARRAR